MTKFLKKSILLLLPEHECDWVILTKIISVSEFFVLLS